MFLATESTEDTEIFKKKYCSVFGSFPRSHAPAWECIPALPFSVTSVFSVAHAFFVFTAK